jgi:hypothetical protein
LEFNAGDFLITCCQQNDLLPENLTAGSCDTYAHGWGTMKLKKMTKPQHACSQNPEAWFSEVVEVLHAAANFKVNLTELI